MRWRSAVLVMLAAFASFSVDGAAARQPAAGKIQWLLGHQRRGDSLASAGIPVTSTTGSHWQPVRFARLLSPDPESTWRLAVTLIGKHGHNICLTLFDSREPVAGGCAFASLLRPFSAMTTTKGNELVISGLASDRVKRLSLALQGGMLLSAPLLDNAFLIALPKKDHTVRLIAYDKAGAVIGTTPASAPKKLP